MDLTDKQKRFCEEYLTDLNATQAAIRSGYSKKTAAVIGQENLTKPNIQEYLSELNEIRKQDAEKKGITPERVLEELAKIAFLNPKQVFDEHDNIKSIQEIDSDTASAIAQVDINVMKSGDTIKRIKFIDKKGALELLGKHFAMFTDNQKVEHEHSVIIDDIAVIE